MTPSGGTSEPANVELSGLYPGRFNSAWVRPAVPGRSKRWLGCRPRPTTAAIAIGCAAGPHRSSDTRPMPQRNRGVKWTQAHGPGDGRPNVELSGLYPGRSDSHQVRPPYPGSVLSGG